MSIPSKIRDVNSSAICIDKNNLYDGRSVHDGGKNAFAAPGESIRSWSAV